MKHVPRLALAVGLFVFVSVGLPHNHALALFDGKLGTFFSPKTAGSSQRATPAAPTAILLSWNTFGNTGTETTEPSSSNDPNIATSNLTLGAGVTAAANANRFGGSAWFDTGDTAFATTPDQSIAGNDYIQFVVQPNSGYSVTYTSFVFRWDRSGTGPTAVTLRSSADNFSTNLGTVTDIASSAFVDNTINISGLSNLSSPVTFRLYGYGGTAIGGTGGFDSSGAATGANVVLNGTVALTAVPGELSWTAASYNVNEGAGTATLTIQRAGGTSGTVGATYALTDNGATGGASCGVGVDYINTGGTVSFADGETSKQVSVTICDDSVYELNEGGFNATLSGPTGGATIGAPNVTLVTINDNDPRMFTVDVFTDSDNGSLNACTGADGDCSLRGAISSANDGDTVTISLGSTFTGNSKLSPQAVLVLEFGAIAIRPT